MTARMTKAAMQARIAELTSDADKQAQTTGTLLDRIAQLEKQRDELLTALKSIDAHVVPSAVNWYCMQALIARCEWGKT